MHRTELKIAPDCDGRSEAGTYTRKERMHIPSCSPSKLNRRIINYLVIPSVSNLLNYSMCSGVIVPCNNTTNALADL